MRALDKRFRLVVTGTETAPVVSTVESIVVEGDLSEKPKRTPLGNVDFSNSLASHWQGAIVATEESEGLNES